ncbi:MAG: 4-(cytidine 5'-diphospho)-2-C-methyl-D-erythritol kinase [Armatimonadota bacterium]
MSEVRLRAFCKINLCLEVLGRRPDGYHELMTVFQSLSLADEVRVGTRHERGITLDVDAEGVPPGRANLAWQAAGAYRQERSWPRGISIGLVKRIPVGAGLGGGSTDAAAVLNGLAELDPEPLGVLELRALAADLGADVPFFITGGAAIGCGRGDEIRGLPGGISGSVVLARPEGLQISTAEAYSMLSEEDFTDGAAATEMATLLEEFARLHVVAELVRNAFSRSLVERWPLLGDLRERLRGMGALAAEVTGSGSAVFGLFERMDEAERAAQSLAAEGHWTRVTEPMQIGAEIIEPAG